MTWLKIENAPFDRDLELAVIDYDGTHALAFPCRRILGGWVKAISKARVEVRRTGGSGIHPKIKAASVGGLFHFDVTYWPKAAIPECLLSRRSGICARTQPRTVAIAKAEPRLSLVVKFA